MSYDVPKINPKFCGNCGQKLLEEATFCAYCGTPVPSADQTGIAGSKPSSEYTTPPPSFATRPTPSRDYLRVPREPPNPFVQHFQGALLSPQFEMPRIAKRPNVSQPFLVVLLCGIIAGIAMYIIISKSTIEFSPAFVDNLGLSGLDIDSEEYLQFMQTIMAFSTPLGFLFSWLLGSLVLWILQAIFSSKIPSHKRNFKTMLTIVGWSFLPRIFNELIRLIIFVVLVEPTTYVIDDLFDISALNSPIGLAGDILFFADLIFFIWGVGLVYFAVKSIDPEGSHAVIIGIIYAVVIFLFG